MSHNYGRYLGQAIESVLAQSRPAAAIVVIDDASSDDTPEVLQRYAAQVQCHRVEFRSQQRTRNHGLAHARTEYVLFLDADDHMAVDMIEQLEDALDRHPQSKLAYCDKLVFGDEAAMRRLNLAPRWHSRAFSLEALRFKNFIMATSLIRRRCIESFDERIVRLTDWDTWLGMLANESDAIYVPAALLHYRVHGSNVSIQKRELIERLKILTKHGLLPLSQADVAASPGLVLNRGAGVVVVTCLPPDARHTTIGPWKAIAQRHGWKLRAVVGVCSAQDGGTRSATVLRDDGSVLQTAPAADLEDVLRRFSGVVADPMHDVVIVTPDPTAMDLDRLGHAGNGVGLRCELSIDKILEAQSLSDLGTFVLSPAAVQLLLYLPQARRPGPVARLRRRASEFVSQHISWRLSRRSSAVTIQKR